MKSEIITLGLAGRVMSRLLIAATLFALSHRAHAEILDLSSFGHGQIITNVVTSNGTIVISAQNLGGGPDLAVIFSTTNTGTRDPDIEGPPSGFWNGGNIPSNQVLGNAIILEEQSTDTDADGFIDTPFTEPDDEAGGGLIFFDLPTNALEASFFWVDYEASVNNFIHFSDGVNTNSIEFTEFSNTNSPFFTAGVVEADNAANEFVPLNVADLTNLTFFTRFWFELDGSGAINNVAVFFANQVGSIGDFVWLDLDGDGIQDGGTEIGISNVTVNLHVDKNTNGVIDAEDDLLATAVTDASGLYLFSDRSTRAYLVDVTDTNSVLAGLALTGGTDPHSVSLGVAEVYTNADFGYQPVRDLDITKVSDATMVTNGQIITYTP
ncbi:MAG: hypothetical protein O2923_11150 [Verrucomicrobia bacterium]|nr:hypothetical protein [Verrucomicrobiota bacterium]MDA1087213.1 hypothetical protein [Verrucomicrobiota bacterium]